MTPGGSAGPSPDVIVIGAGLIGCSVAFELGRRGVSVLVLDRSGPAREATWAAGGMLSPLSEGLSPGSFRELGLASLRLYRSFVGSIGEASGLPVEVVASGKLMVAFDPGVVGALWEAHSTPDIGEPGSVQRVSRAEVLEREPALSPDVQGGVLFPEEGQVDNRLLGRAACRAAEAVGARVLGGSRVRAVRATDRAIQGVELRDGTRVDAGAVVVAAGAWSGEIRGLPRPLPVRPVRGQMVSLEMGAASLETVVETPEAYLIPRPGGPLVVGSTMEEAGFAVETTEAAVAGLVSAARRALPDLADGPPLERWAGLRPGTPDGLPILGPDPEIEGLYYATGHFRNGILLAPVTAASLAASILRDETGPVDLGPFRPDRFPSSVPASPWSAT